MKKKLIAIVTSLAMVATMVPATAFAAGASQSASARYTMATTKEAPTFADKNAAIAAITTGGICAKDKNSVTYDVDYVAYKALETAITDEGWESEIQTSNGPEYTAFTQAVGVLDDYHTTVEAAATAVDTANDKATIGASDSDVVAAKTAVAKISATSSDCKISADTKLAEVLNGAGTANDSRYTDYQDTLAIAAAADAIAATTQAEITDANAAAAKTALDAANAALAKVPAAKQDKIANKANLAAAQNFYNTYIKTGATNVEKFQKAVDAIGDISGYTADADRKVIAAYDAYTALTAADKEKVKEPLPNNNYSYYTMMMNAITTQWNARLAKLEKSVKAVDIVRPAAGDVTSIAAIDTLKKDYDLFNVGEPNDKLRVAINDADLETDLSYDFPALETKVAAALAAASTAYTAAAGVEEIVLDIAGLPTVNGSNYQDVLDAIAAISNGTNGSYDALSGALKKKVGNYHDLQAKKEAAETLKQQVTDVTALVNNIDKQLKDPDGSRLLTKNEIQAYTDAYNKAKEAYEELDKGQKAKVDAATPKTLLYAAGLIKAYQEGLDKEIAAEKAMSTLPNGRDPENTLTIAEAKAAYDALVARNTTPVGTLNKLDQGFQDNIGMQLEHTLDAIVKEVLTLGLKDNGKVSVTKVDTAVAPVQALIEALPATITLADQDALEAAREAYDVITTAFEGEADDQGVTAAIRTALAADKVKLEAAEDQMKTIVNTNEAKIRGFIAAVARISGVSGTVAVQLEAITETNQVDGNYYNFTRNARATYDALTDDQKAIIQRTKAPKVENALTAYEKLLVAEKNVAASRTLDQVAALIKAVPDAATLNVKDTAAVAKVKEAQAAYEALTEGAQNQLTEKNYITVKELKNYEDAVKKVNDAENKTASAAVVELIKALPSLPTAFSSQTEINAAYTLLTKAEEGFNALTKAQQALVTNADILSKYRTDFDRLMKTYADALYKKAAALDPAAELTAEDIALIAELNAYVKGGYIETKNIAGFDQKVYDALIALLDANAALENATIADIPAVTYTGAEQKPAVTVTDKSGKAVPTDAYEVTYSNNEDAGTALVTVSALTGKGYTGVTSKAFTINPANIKTAAKAAAIAKQVYNKKAKKPAVSVTAGSKKLVKDADYKVAYKNNTNIGKATVTITGTDNYTGTITTTFIITPAKGKLTSLKAGKKQITVSYEAQKASGKTGYYLVYSPAKGKAKTTTTTSTKKTIKGLKSGKTYKVKVRAYKTIGGTKYYGKYSDVKKVRVK